MRKRPVSFDCKLKDARGGSVIKRRSQRRWGSLAAGCVLYLADLEMAAALLCMLAGWASAWVRNIDQGRAGGRLMSDMWGDATTDETRLAGCAEWHQGEGGRGCGKSLSIGLPLPTNRWRYSPARQAYEERVIIYETRITEDRKMTEPEQIGRCESDKKRGSMRSRWGYGILRRRSGDARSS